MVCLLFNSHVSFCVIAYDTLWRFLWLGNLARDFLGVKFWYRDLFGFCLKPKGFFGVLIFGPTQSSLSFEILRALPPPPPTPLGSTFLLLTIAVVTVLSVKITILVSAPKVFTHS